MPWKETRVMDNRIEFVLRALREEQAFSELCREYGISRKTGYKWQERFLEQGLAGLEEASRKPTHSPQELREEVVCGLVALKEAHRHWGPRKVRTTWARRHPLAAAPSESSVKRVLQKAGLVTKRRRQPSETGGRIAYRVEPTAPNGLWTVDFKGRWHTGTRERCEPLTVRDAFSRFVLCARPLENARSATVRSEFEGLFETYGLPGAIRSDNGVPFACTRAPLGLSRLSAWWVTLGIALDRIPPGRPDQNGAHERMHRDIALEVERFPETDLAAQRAVLETWRQEYNFERPHEALGMRVPGELYRPSERVWRPGPVELVYPADYLTRRVSPSGVVSVEGMKIPVSTALSGWPVGLKPCGEAGYLVWFGPLCLGTLDLAAACFRAADAQGG